MPGSYYALKEDTGMEELKVRILEEYRGNINPERKYHLVDISNGREAVGNLKKEEIKPIIDLFHLTLIED